MSLYHYIAANHELPTGSFGMNKEMVIHENGEIEYESLEDLAGIGVHDLGAEFEAVKKHFHNQFVYHIFENCGNFHISEDLMENFPEDFLLNGKCLIELFNYIECNLTENGMIEIYSCWIGEETESKEHKLTTEIHLNRFSLSNNFSLKDRQYFKVTK